MLLATGINGDGHREVLGLRVATSETGQAWNEFFAVAPTWSGSSPTVTPSSGSWGPSWLNRPTNGPKAAATWDSTFSPLPHEPSA